MATKAVGTPTMRGIKDSATDWAVGLGGGILYALTTSFFGSGLLGGITGAAIAGSVIKGDRGTILATVLGFQSIVTSAQSAGSTASANTQAEVM